MQVSTLLQPVITLFKIWNNKKALRDQSII